MKSTNIIDKKLKKKIIYFIIMFFVFLGTSIVFAINDEIPLKYPLYSFLIGIGIGGILSRIQNVTWDKDSQKIIKEFDIISAILLFLLILFVIFKNQIVQTFVNFHKISSLIFALNSGIMLGRIILLRRNIKAILRNKTD